MLILELIQEVQSRGVLFQTVNMSFLHCPVARKISFFFVAGIILTFRLRVYELPFISGRKR